MAAGNLDTAKSAKRNNAQIDHCIYGETISVSYAIS